MSRWKRASVDPQLATLAKQHLRLKRWCHYYILSSSSFWESFDEISVQNQAVHRESTWNLAKKILAAASALEIPMRHIWIDTWDSLLHCFKTPGHELITFCNLLCQLSNPLGLSKGQGLQSLWNTHTFCFCTSYTEDIFFPTAKMLILSL